MGSSGLAFDGVLDERFKTDMFLSLQTLFDKGIGDTKEFIDYTKPLIGVFNKGFNDLEKTILANCSRSFSTTIAIFVNLAYERRVPIEVIAQELVDNLKKIIRNEIAKEK